MKSLLKPLMLAAFLLTLSIFLPATTNTMVYEQTVRGTIVDQDSKIPVIGANVILLGSNPIRGASTDLNGNFRIEKVPVGRINLQITYLGYETKTLSNLVVGSGKEVVLNIELVESVVKIEDITVKAKARKSEALNEMATVSAKVVSVEETKRYAGTFNDPARMVSSFAGVTGDPEGNNDIIVRGNSPRGILWRLEGIEIPNPNHFANEGASGGPINALNSAMLDNSDFFSGAFAPEYGNAYSGVFDMKLRNGNNEKREYSFSAGALGIDFTAEGPYSKNYRGSFLVNYRYSSLGILDDLGIVDFYGIPKYQDVSFKTVLPTKKTGTYSIFGLGGLSNIYQIAYADETEEFVTRNADFSSNLGVIGVNHTYQLNNNSYLKTSVSASGTENKLRYNKRDMNSIFYTAGKENFINTSIKVSTCYNRKINAKHRIKSGITYNDLGYDFFAEHDVNNTGELTTKLDSKGRAGLIQGYFNWKYRLYDNMTMITGLHYMHFLYNNSQSLEPRLGLEYQTYPGQSFTFGFGIHSKVESLATYQVQLYNNNDQAYYPNKELDLAKSMHFVVGYKQQLNQNLHFKTEVYYQYLYDVAVENDPESPIVLNNWTGGYGDIDFVNKGSGKNYGIELTLERFYSNRFYYLITGSLYDSKFTALDGVERNSAFNGNYASNILLGKEFPIGDRSKNRTIGINFKATFIGGAYYTPIDLQASIDADDEVYNMDRFLDAKAQNIFKADMGLTYRRDRKKTTHELKIDIQNLTNNQAVVDEYYDNENQEIYQATQWSLFPNIIYTIQF